MTFQAIACDYDCTLAREGRVAPATLQVLNRARTAGRKMVLVTGRTLRDLQSVFPYISVFDIVVVENGCVLFEPSSGLEQLLCPELPSTFIKALTYHRIPFSTGKRVVASHRPYEGAVQKVIDELKIDAHVILNRESVMILPGDIDKGSGLKAALLRLRLKASEVVGIGDAENDLSFLQVCGFSVAVANAIDSLKSEVDYVTQGEDGAGTSEIIEQVIAGGPLLEAIVERSGARRAD